MPLTSRPYLVENEQVAHAEALAYLLQDTAEQHPLCVATGYVNLAGLRVLATATSDGRATRLLLGAAPSPGLDAELPLARFTDLLAALRGERDFSRFPPSRAAADLAEVDGYLLRENVEVRRYTRTFLHGKAYLLGTAADARSALVSSANLTGPGMRTNRELGLVDYQPNVAAEAIAWFDRLWAEATPYKDELRTLLFPAAPLVTPEDVYLRTLLELYGDELFGSSERPPTADSRVVLASFQRDGYERARAILSATMESSTPTASAPARQRLGLRLLRNTRYVRVGMLLWCVPRSCAACGNGGSVRLVYRRRSSHSRNSPRTSN